MHAARLAGTLTTLPSTWVDPLRNLPRQVDLLEVRADRIGHVDPDWLRSHFRGRLLFTLRSRAEGGACDAAPEERQRRLKQAACRYDLVDLEAERDLVPELLAQIPPDRRVISWAGPTTDAHSLHRRAEHITAVRARLYKIVPDAAVTSDGVPPLAVLRAMNRSDLIAFAGGDAGFWSRLLSLHAGAPFIFGTVGVEARALSEPTIEQLIQDYGLPDWSLADRLYGIVGSPVAQSLSPQLHNRAYRALGAAALFLPFEDQHLPRFWRDMVEADPLARIGLPIKGLTIVSPHKDMAVKMGARGSAMVQRAGSANIAVKNCRGWRADTTDPEGVVEALRERGISISRLKTAVIGCGGAGRAVAAALDLLGADVTLVNRSLDRGLRARQRLRLPFTPLAEFSPRDYSMVVNATPVGRDGESLPFDLAPMRTHGVVVDLTYGRDQTPLIRRAHDLGLTAVDGREVCLIQVRHQFRMMTGLEMPEPGSAKPRALPAVAGSAALRPPTGEKPRQEGMPMSPFQYARADEQLVPGQGPFVVDPAPLLGHWTNTNRTTTGIARVEISSGPEGVTMSIWPAAMPGGKPGHRAIADAVYSSGPMATAAMALSASYDDELIDTKLEANLSLGLLVIATCHTFKNDGTRSNYFAREFFHYAEEPSI